MKISVILILTFLIVTTAAILAGCTGSEKPTTPATDSTPQPTQITAEATVVPTETTGPQTEEGLKIGDQVKAAEITGNDFSWYEYQINLTTELPPNGVVRQISYKNTERSMSEYNGTPAILFKTISKGRSWNLVSDNYYDTSMSNFLGGKIVTTRDGELPYTEEFSPSEVNREMSGFFKKERMLTYQGTEPITVPAGTYPDAKKYTIYNSDNDVMYTYWFAPDVPIPILIHFPNKYITGNNGFESHELSGWG